MARIALARKITAATAIGGAAFLTSCASATSSGPSAGHASAITTSAAAVATAGAATSAAGTVACPVPGLVAWLGSGNGAGGSTYYDLQFTNLSGRTCTLYGFPGISAVDVYGHQIGRAAGRVTTQTSSSVTLQNGQTATAILQVIATADLPAGQCRPVTVAGLRIYPPGQRHDVLVPYPFPTCSTRRLSLFIEPVTHAVS